MHTTCNCGFHGLRRDRAVRCEFFRICICTFTGLRVVGQHFFDQAHRDRGIDRHVFHARFAAFLISVIVAISGDFL